MLLIFKNNTWATFHFSLKNNISGKVFHFIIRPFLKITVTEIQKLKLNFNSSNPVNTGRKFKLYKTFKRCPGMDKQKIQMNLNGEILKNIA